MALRPLNAALAHFQSTHDAQARETANRVAAAARRDVATGASVERQLGVIMGALNGPSRDAIHPLVARAAERAWVKVPPHRSFVISQRFGEDSMWQPETLTARAEWVVPSLHGGALRVTAHGYRWLGFGMKSSVKQEMALTQLPVRLQASVLMRLSREIALLGQHGQFEVKR